MDASNQLWNCPLCLQTLETQSELDIVHLPFCRKKYENTTSWEQCPHNLMHIILDLEYDYHAKYCSDRIPDCTKQPASLKTLCKKQVIANLYDWNQTNHGWTISSQQANDLLDRLPLPTGLKKELCNDLVPSYGYADFNFCHMSTTPPSGTVPFE